MDSAISLQAIVVAAPDQISCRLDDETVLLELKKGVYFGLNQAGTIIWELIQQPQSLQNIHSALLERFDVDPETCKRDVLRLLQDLHQAGLVDLRPV